MSKKVIIIGGHGKGEQIMDCINDNRLNFGDEEYEVAGFLNDFTNVDISGYRILGKLKDIQKFIDQGYYFSFGIHPISQNNLIIYLYESLNIPLEKLATVISKRSFISPTTIIEPGVVVLPFSYVSLHVKLSTCSLVMAKATVGHNSILGKCCFLGAGSILGSNVQLGDAVSVGIGATVIEARKIGNCSVIGAGSMLLKDVPESSIFVGNPATYLKAITKT